MKIELTTNPEEKEAELISNGIVEFNKKAIPDLEPVEAEIKFFVFSKDEEGNVNGGIRAVCYWNTLHIELLWLSESLRGLGIGKEMIKKAENFALKNNCENVFVETTSWQAKPFYEKVGYTHIATINNRPKGHASHYLTKKLK